MSLTSFTITKRACPSFAISKCLKNALEFAHDKLGHDRVLVTCDDDNIGSIKTIENNGGVLENVVSGSDLDKPKRRYWIDVCRATT